MRSKHQSKKPSLPPKPKSVPRFHKPDGMSLEEWQVALRRQWGRSEPLTLKKNLGDHPVFSTFEVHNAKSRGTYRVVIRGREPGGNYCSCPDFAVNTLGTCKHVEFVLARVEKKRGAARFFKQGYHPAYSSITLRYGAERHVVFRSGKQASPDLLGLASRYFDNGRLTAKGFDHFDTLLKKALVLDPDLRCYDDALAFIAQVRAQAALPDRVEAAFPDGINSDALKSLMKVPLYPYQWQGALFAAKNGRSIIADDMGLGKTVQAIAAARILMAVVGVARVLIVCPTSLKYQWKQEMEKFADINAQVIEGGLVARKKRYVEDVSYKIINYDIVHKDTEFINAWKPDLIILDEAQRIKNWETRAAKSVKQLSSPYAMVLTGTPLENRLAELHSIVEFVDRFHLGPLFRFLDHHQDTDPTGQVLGYRNLSQVAKTLAPILIRRRKADVLKELPERVEKKVFLPMTKYQQQLHDDNLETVVRIVAKWKRYHFLSDADQKRLHCALQNMRMSCNSSYLLDPKTDSGVKVDELMSILAQVFEDPTAKVVIFSQWLRTHELIIQRLEKRNWGHAFFNGGVSSKGRAKLIAQFRESPDCRVFLSTDAGGVGLNLQHASTVVNMDLPWNPAVLEQRIGRVHRLGQHRAVLVVNLISQGTIEHHILDILAFKTSLFSGVLDGGQDTIVLGGSRLSRFMESVEAVTQDINATVTEPAPSPSVDAPSATQEETVREANSQTSNVHTEESEPVSDKTAEGRSSEVAWQELVTTGLSMMQQFGTWIKQLEQGAPSAKSGALPKALPIRYHPDTREPYLHIPIPKPEMIQKIATTLRDMSKVLLQ